VRRILVKLRFSTLPNIRNHQSGKTQTGGIQFDQAPRSRGHDAKSGFICFSAQDENPQSIPADIAWDGVSDRQSTRRRGSSDQIKQWKHMGVGALGVVLGGAAIGVMLASSLEPIAELFNR
jgi:hypothetical protein